MSESELRVVNIYYSTVCLVQYIYVILTVSYNPIDTRAAVPTLEEIQQANLILILPTAAYGILLWGAGSLYYLLEY